MERWKDVEVEKIEMEREVKRRKCMMMNANVV